MCNANNVLHSTTSSAAVMVSTIYEYGGNSLGNGIRKFAKEMFECGYDQGVRTSSKAYYSGYMNVFITNSLITIGTCGFIYGISKIINNEKDDRDYEMKNIKRSED